MTRRESVTMIAVGVAAAIALVLSPRSRAAGEGASILNEEFLAKLRTRDEQFNKVQLIYLMRGTQTIKDYSWKFPDRDNVRPAQLPKEYKYIYRDDLIVRGDDITHIRKVIEPAAGEGGIQMMRYTKTANIGGLRTELALEDAESNQGFVSSGDERSAGYHSESHLRMVIEFALGFGFGRRMTNVETMETTETGFDVTGRIGFGRTRDFPCSLELDRDLVVRRAVVDVPNGRMEVTTKGSQSQDGFIFAKTGRMRNFDGDKAKDDYFIDYQESHFNLSDARYRELTTIEVPDEVEVVH
jgi:hypothetical protein